MSFAGVDRSVKVTVKITSPEVGEASNLACGKRLFTGAGLTVIFIVAGSLEIPESLVTLSVTVKILSSLVSFTKICDGLASLDKVSSPKFHE